MKTRAFSCFILTGVLFIASVGHASFRNNYMTGQDLLTSLAIKFAGIKPIGRCGKIQDDDRSTMGENNVVSGDPASEEPGTSFITIYDDCIKNYMYAILARQSSDGTANDAKVETKLIPALFGPLLPEIDHARSPMGLARSAVLQTVQFPKDPNLQKALIANWVDWALGTDEEILSFGRMQDPDAFRADLLKHLLQFEKTNPYLLSITIEALQIIMKRDEFLLYR